MDVCDKVLRSDYSAMWHEDNQAMIRVVRSGRNPTMRHLNRVHRVDIASMHEKQEIPRIKLVYEKSTTMAADIYTKGFVNNVKWHNAISLINVLSSEDLKKIKTQYRK